MHNYEVKGSEFEINQGEIMWLFDTIVVVPWGVNVVYIFRFVHVILFKLRNETQNNLLLFGVHGNYKITTNRVKHVICLACGLVMGLPWYRAVFIQHDFQLLNKITRFYL
jgi:hypothetical protein